MCISILETSDEYFVCAARDGLLDVSEGVKLTVAFKKTCSVRRLLGGGAPFCTTVGELLGAGTRPADAPVFGAPKEFEGTTGEPAYVATDPESGDPATPTLASAGVGLLAGKNWLCVAEGEVSWVPRNDVSTARS